jgi:beta-lactamase class A
MPGRNRIFLALAGLIFIVGILVGYQINNWQTKNKEADKVKYSEWHDRRYKLISPLLACETDDSSLSADLSRLKSGIEDYIDKRIEKDYLSHVSVYFRDLNNGPWFGIEEKELYVPASLVKVPVMMAVYRSAEDDPGILEKALTIETPRELVLTQYYEPEKTVEIGESYTTRELLEARIVYSDNLAFNTLASYVGQNRVEKVFMELGLPAEQNEDGEIILSVKNYAAVFRVLYNASYLIRDYSEEALELLARSKFKEGILAGIEDAVLVAHKFGERTSLTTDGWQQRQLSECGIVYTNPDHYLLCVMSKGEQFKELEQVISHISEMVYTEVKRDR